MQDLMVALGVMLVLCLIVLGTTILLTRRLSKRTTTLAGVLSGLVIVWYIKFLWGKAALADLLPYSSLIVLGNWFPLVAAFLAGITWTHGYGPKRRRVLFGTAVFLISVYSVVQPLMGEPPPCMNEWEADGVCRQTSQHTCSAAAGATLLRRYGIQAQESEMAELCLTRVGTTWQGLYRGLKLKTADSPFDVEVFECATADNFVTQFRGPAIISVGIPTDRPAPRVYSEEWGWKPGVRHSVVVLELIDEEMMVIADPSIGTEIWAMVDLRALWLGRGIRLVPKDGVAPPTPTAVSPIFTARGH